MVFAGNAVNISQVVVNTGETAKLFYHRVASESSERFRFYRVKKDRVPFSLIEHGSNTSHCVEGTVLKEFCLNKTEFKKWNASYLILKIKETVVNDSGSYSVHSVFKGLAGDSAEEILLAVRHLNVTGESVMNILRIV